MHNPQLPSPSPLPEHGLRCLCGASFGRIEGPTQWVLAVHRAAHDPSEVITVTAKLAESILSMLDFATRWTEVVAPGLTTDLRAAMNVIAASDSTSERGVPLPAEVARLLARTCQQAALALSTTLVDESVVSELDSIAYALAESVERPRAEPVWPEHREPVFFPRVAGSSDSVVQLIAACTTVIRRPLLASTFAPALERELIEGRPAVEMTRELAELCPVVADVEASVRGLLGRLRRTAQPVAVASDTTLNALAGCALDLHLARLRATHLTGTLAASSDSGLVCWAVETGTRIATRLTAVADQLSLLLCCFET